MPGEGVKPFQILPGQFNAQPDKTASQTAQVNNKEPKPSTLTPPASADFKNADSAHHAATASRAIAILDSKHVYSNATPDSKQKRSRQIAEPDDAPESATKRTRSAVTEQPYAPTASQSKRVGPFFTPINAPTITPDKASTATDAINASDPISAPTTDLISAHLATTDPSHEPITGEIIGHIIVRVKIPVVKEDLGDLEALPFSGIECDHNMRTADPQAWARWAKALHTEINSLTHVSDVGPLTNNLIGMMVKDGVWPGPVSNTAAQEE